MDVTAIAGVPISQINEQLGEKAVTAISKGNSYESGGYLYFDLHGFECYWGIDTDPILLGICGEDKEFIDFESFENELILQVFGVSTMSENDLFFEPLTPREKDVFALLVKDLSNKAIAQELKCSLSTAKAHVANILNKAGLERKEFVDRCKGSAIAVK